MTDRIKVYVIDYSRKFLVFQWTDPTTGKRKTLSSKCTKRRDAERRAAELEESLNSLIPRGDGLISWDLFAKEFWEKHLLSLEDSSASRFDSVLSMFKKEMDPANLRAVNGSVLSDYASKLRELGRSETTISTHMTHLRAALRWARENNYVTEIPQFPRVVKGKRARAKGRPLTDKEFVAFLRAVTPTLIRRMKLLLTRTAERRRAEIRTWRRFIIGLWLSGLRLNEAIELTWNDLHSPISIITTEKHPLLNINHDGQKSKESQLLPLTPDFGRWILRKTPEAERVGVVFPLAKERHHEARRQEHISKVISDIGKTSGVKVSSSGKFASAHDLRRTFGLRWSSRVMPPELQQLMRHENIETTMKFYAIVSANEFAKRLWDNHTTRDTTAK